MVEARNPDVVRCVVLFGGPRSVTVLMVEIGNQGGLGHAGKVKLLIRY